MRVYISLTKTEAERLSEVARRERRRPKDQAAYLVARALDEHRDSTELPALTGTEPSR